MPSLYVHRELKIKHKTSGSINATIVANYLCLIQHRQNGKTIIASINELVLPTKGKILRYSPLRARRADGSIQIHIVEVGSTNYQYLPKYFIY